MRIKIGGRVRAVYSTAVMAKKIKRSQTTIRRWEREKILPAAIFRDGQGRRYYLTEEIEVLADLVAEFDMQKTRKTLQKKFTKRIIEEWSRIRGKQAKPITRTRGKKTNGTIELW